MHLLHDVATTNKLALDVYLRDRGPVRVLLDLLPEFLTLEHIHVLILLHPIELEDLDHVVGEAAPRHLSIALHEQAYVVFRHPLVNLRVHITSILAYF